MCACALRVHCMCTACALHAHAHVTCACTCACTCTCACCVARAGSCRRWCEAGQSGDGDARRPRHDRDADDDGVLPVTRLGRLPDVLYPQMAEAKRHPNTSKFFTGLGEVHGVPQAVVDRASPTLFRAVLKATAVSGIVNVNYKVRSDGTPAIPRAPHRAARAALHRVRSAGHRPGSKHARARPHAHPARLLRGAQGATAGRPRQHGRLSVEIASRYTGTVCQAPTAGGHGLLTATGCTCALLQP